MKAAVFEQPGKPLVIGERDAPRIAENEMLLRVKYCGICGTDIHASREGPFMAPPGTVFGHEFAGEIVEIGSGVSSNQFEIGERVTSLPFIGDQTIGLGDVDGGYAEFVKVDHQQAVKLPDTIDDVLGALVEPMAVGLHSVKMADTVAGKKVLIVGAGPIGLACAIWCRFFGADKVVFSEFSATRIRIAETIGFSEFINPEKDVGEEFRSLAGAEPDVQFECVGAPGMLQSCIERAPPRGLVMGIGVCDSPDSITPLLAFMKELRIQWAVGYDKVDFEFTIKMMTQGRLEPMPMVTDIISLEEVPVFFEQLRQPSSQCKVLIDLMR
ncbi:MAG: alcohol dehydrogenase [Gammaproteobacteria bacterium]|jgi:(R,R)-butanediol dehydrogenase/meso-butanediol dehydrogenase/diacetyl reductase|nr:alcohol dehydrogenase [Gammaproteobacteria bacterium]|tara:strand:+ start:2264 stop:3241 length:978 start_codon:yes stop_codon:yes gene_type:complete